MQRVFLVVGEGIDDRMPPNPIVTAAPPLASPEGGTLG
jgi:hypothetical protein